MKKQKRRKARGRYTAEVERHVVALIEQWPTTKRLKWTGIVDMVKHDLGHEWTRQTLEKKPAIRKAYETHGARHRVYAATGKVLKLPAPEVVVLQQNNVRLRAENDALRDTLRRSDERLVRYLANANRFGISQELLEAPILKIVGSDVGGPGG